MDSLISSAIEETCACAATGIQLPDLFTSLTTTASSLGLPLGATVKQALWARLLTVPVFKFELHGSAIENTHPSIQSVDEAERIAVKLIAEDSTRDNFLGIYDLKAASGDMSKVQRDTLEMLAAARSDGITQNELCKRTGKKGNDYFYVVKSLSSQGLIVRQPIMIREKEQGESSKTTPTIINTNLLHLYRYGRKMNLNSQQRIEVVKNGLLNEGECSNNNEDVSIKDFLPGMKDICDRLKEAKDKVLVVSDIKLALGYRWSKGHRAWRNILNRLKDANLVEEFNGKVNGKPVACVKLLRPFNAAEFQPKAVAYNNNNNNNKLSYEELSKRGKRGYVNEQYVELPLDHRIYDLVESAGSKGITINEVGRRLGIAPKKLTTRLALLRERFNMVYQNEEIDRTKQYRYWTHQNYSYYKSSSQNPELIPTPDNIANNNNNDNNNSLSIVESSQSNSENNNNNNWVENSLAVVQVGGENNGKIVSVEAENGPLCNIGKSGGRNRKIDWRYLRVLSVPSAATREERIQDLLKKERFLLAVEIYKWLENLEKEKNTKMGRRTLINCLNKLQQEGKCKNIKVSIPGLTNCNRSRLTDVVLHPNDSLSQELLDEIQKRHRKFEFDNRRGGIAKKKEADSPVTVLPAKPCVKSNEESNIMLTKMRFNGYLLAKMVRAKLLHKFLWEFVSGLPGWREKIESDEVGSSCQVFEMDKAVKEMPLELFLQVVGSPLEIDSMVSKCKLCELPVKDYESLMDKLANMRFSGVIDILARLKLIKLVRAGEDDVSTTSARLEHALEQKPYIEEPFRKTISSTRSSRAKVGPIIRHDFVLSKKETLDAYWETLEYCYANASCIDASHAFPATSCREVLSRQAWTWTWIMTLEQRAELLKRLSNFGIEKIPFKECVTFARELNLSVEQVLRVSRTRRQSLIYAKSDKTGRQSSESVARAFSRKRKRNQKSINPLEKLGIGGILRKKAVFSKRFTWTDKADRQLIMQYVRRRVYLGPNIHRADWSSISDLPALPATCRRRMAILNQNLNIRRAISRLCNILSKRYAKYTEMAGIDRNESIEGNVEFCWDDFEDPEVKNAFEEVIECKKIAKMEYRKKDGTKSTKPVSEDRKKGEEAPPDNADMASTSADLAPATKDREIERLRKRFPDIFNSKGEMVKLAVFDSLAAANAVELLKMACLTSSSASESVQENLESILQMYSERDLYIAFAYLKQKYYMVAGQGSQPYVLSPKFFNDLYTSPFPVGTGKRASEFTTWLKTLDEQTLITQGVSLSSDPQCGETVRLLSLVSNGNLTLSPLLPEQGIGECIEENKMPRIVGPGCQDDDVSGTNKRKADKAELKEEGKSVKRAKRVKEYDAWGSSRKVKGFPGIQIRVKKIPSDNNNSCSSATSASATEDRGEAVITVKGESPWHAMKEYLSVKWRAEISADVLRSVCSVINKAGEEGVSFEQISDAYGPQELGASVELIVETLEKFGFVIKVHGYDSVRVLKSDYRSKYHINNSQKDSIKSQVPANNETLTLTLDPILAAGPTRSLCEGHKVTIIENKNSSGTENEGLLMEEEREREENEEREGNVVDYNIVSNVSSPILPWINADGSLNSTVFEALTRRVLGIIMQKPGMLEEDIIQQMDVLNPQSCRRLLETLVQDKHLSIRIINQKTSGPPSILQGIFSSSISAPVCKKHFFVNPETSIVLL